MPIVERYQSPDGILQLIVAREGQDWLVGFAGYDWHTHGDILSAWGYEGPAETATRAFVEDLLSSRREICVCRKLGRIISVNVPSLYDDRPLQAQFARHAAADEILEVRYWNGSTEEPETVVPSVK